MTPRRRGTRGRPGGARRLPALALGAVLAACEPAAQPAPFRPAADLESLMVAVFEPSASRLANALAVTLDERGEERVEPLGEEDWISLRNAAVVLAESPNLLLMPERIRDRGEWVRAVLAQVEVGEAALAAVESRDVEQLSELGERIYSVCSDCHQKYPPASVGGR